MKLIKRIPINLIAGTLGVGKTTAINHLLARQVIGIDSHVETDDVEGFYPRYEHIILPMAVMATALVIVAYVPLLWY